MIPKLENDKLVRQGILASGILALLLLSLPPLAWGKLSQEVPLFYSLPWGEGQIASKPLLFVLGGISFLFIATNILLAKVLEDEIFLRRILWAGCAFASMLALITLVRIVLLFY